MAEEQRSLFEYGLLGAILASLTGAFWKFHTSVFGQSNRREARMAKRIDELENDNLQLGITTAKGLDAGTEAMKQTGKTIDRMTDVLEQVKHESKRNAEQLVSLTESVNNLTKVAGSNSHPRQEGSHS